MIQYLVIAGLIVSGCGSIPHVPELKQNTESAPLVGPMAETATFSRHISITTCAADGQCFGPMKKDIKNTRASVSMDPFSRLDQRGLEGIDQYSIREEGYEFRSEIRVKKFEGELGYEITMHLHSGKSLTRKPATRVITVPDMLSFRKTAVIDEPIAFKGGTLQARLVIGPAKVSAK